MPDINSLSLPDLFRHLASAGLVTRLLELARDEDLGPLGVEGDVTSQAAFASPQQITASLVARAPGTIAGLAAIPELLRVFGGRSAFEHAAIDGQTVHPGAVLGDLSGPARDVLALERTLLNFVGRLSGIATLTARYAAAASPASVYDTRKTTPGMRALEKYAVRCGGGRLHRLGLHDAALFKDNHLAGVALGDLARAVGHAAREARRIAEAREQPLSFVEVEVDSLAQFERLLALEQGLIDIVLLDNMGIDDLRTAAAMKARAKSRIVLEASGGVTLANVREVAATGVERIAVGAITHSAPALDVALDIA